MKAIRITCTVIIFIIMYIPAAIISGIMSPLSREWYIAISWVIILAYSVKVFYIVNQSFVKWFNSKLK